MKKIMFNDKYGLTQAVLEGRKTMTRRSVPYRTLEQYYNYDDWCNSVGTGDMSVEREYEEECFLRRSPYKIGEVIAIAQSYKSIFEKSLNYALPRYHWLDDHIDEKGYANKMFVKAGEMPHHIKMTDIKVERLQDISDGDCSKEGIDYCNGYSDSYYFEHGVKLGNQWIKLGNSPCEAFAALIDKVSGKGTWEENPWVFVYEFKLID